MSLVLKRASKTGSQVDVALKITQHYAALHHDGKVIHTIEDLPLDAKTYSGFIQKTQRASRKGQQ